MFFRKCQRAAVARNNLDAKGRRRSNASLVESSGTDEDQPHDRVAFGRNFSSIDTHAGLW